MSEKQGDKEKVEGRVKEKPVLDIVRVYVKDGNMVRERWGVLSGGKVYLLKKKFLGWKVDEKSFFIVKDEHFYLEEERRGRKTYMVLSVWVDARDKFSLPPPGSDASAWTPEERELAEKVITNTLIMKQFEEERKKVMQLMGRLQIAMVVMFLGALVFAGVLYWYNSQQLMQSIQELMHQMFPSPVG